MIFEVTLTVRVTADNAIDANDWGINAVEHLADTFNDDESMAPFFKVEAQVVEPA